MSLTFIDRGTAPYREIWDEQHRLFDAAVALKRSGLPVTEEYAILVEHNPVYTMGRHADPANMLMTREWLESHGVECIPIERGGDITFHGPGQLVVYPIIDLQQHSLGVREYVTLLEQAVIDTIARWGIKGERVEGATGVWIDKGTPRERKICAIGVRVSRSITMHGLALNVNTDMKYFHLINPCGFVDKGVTSISLETGGGEVDMEVVKSEFRKVFAGLLDRR